jgi:tRNA (5-methylaminomethyl-2-thiouridylate)-methyltransferase
MENNREKKVVIAMSGGVDSSVAAALLVEQGYSVTGMMLKLWSDDCDEESINACCPPEAINQARQVANIIGIPFYVLDVREVFKKMIVDSFIEAYKLGLTPNPCYLCNQNIRWGYFLNRTLDTGFEYFATGHYARIEQSSDGYSLRKGLDPLKDQSYVLSGLNQTQLSHTILPLGNYHKPEVRELARKFALPVAEKHDSQDLCFIGRNGYRDFLNRHAPEAFIPGKIVNQQRETLGTHEGLSNYTIGQRKGLGAGNSEPVYVLEKNLATNELIVGKNQELGKNEFSVAHISWLSGKTPHFPVDYDVKIRYKAAPVLAHLQAAQNGDIIVKLDNLLRDITPGQIAVFYENDSVMGSGVIQSVNRREE